MKPTLHADRAAERLTEVPLWRHRGNAIERIFDCGDFDGSIRFVNAVAAAANAANHHPDLTVAWNLVTLTLASHDAGGLTDRDFDLARVLDALGGTSVP
jgi:4a-hydroxytetrahydrobiopterin dehydratase